MRLQEPNLAFASWVKRIGAQAIEALAFDLDAEAALLRIRAELELVSDALSSDTYALEFPSARSPDARQDHPLVRPYMLPSDRPKPPARLPVETLVVATAPATDAGRAEWRRILDLCQQTRSLAELAAGGRRPLSVTRALVAELFTAGLVTIELPAPLKDDFGRQVVERVLLALRGL